MNKESPCVLVVEDEDAARDIICESLAIAGCEAIGASDGGEARRALEGRERLPCVIVLDLMMPGMNGWEFREWQRQHPVYARVPVVVLSAVRDLAAEAKKLGTDYLAKPITFSALLAKVAQHCGPCAAA
jgi:CheY-like chemotaxis protein